MRPKDIYFVETTGGIPDSSTQDIYRQKIMSSAWCHKCPLVLSAENIIGEVTSIESCRISPDSVRSEVKIRDSNLTHLHGACLAIVSMAAKW